MPITRRQALMGIGALGLLPGTSLAAGMATVEGVQHAFATFDLQTVLLELCTLLDLPRRWKRQIEPLFSGVPRNGGLRGLEALEHDVGFQGRLDALIDRERKRLSTKLTLRRLIHELPEDAADLTPMLEVLCSLIGLDLPGLRAATAELPEGLFIVMGPPTNAGELLGALLREPFIHFLELVHGRRARTWSAGEPRRDLVEGLLDPEIRVVCTLGHGLWDEISMNGFAAVPEAVYVRIRSKLLKDPKKLAPLLQQGALYPFGLTYSLQPLRETDLSELVHAWFPTDAGRHASAKDLVVRYTCGSGRWRVRPNLARALIPESLEEVLDVSIWGLAPARPGADPSTWQEPLEAWLKGHAVELEARTAFGTSLVRDPSDTRGYDGLVWLPDFVETPIPAPTLPWSPATWTPEDVPEPVP